jgi:hypothetical protein
MSDASASILVPKAILIHLLFKGRYTNGLRFRVAFTIALAAVCWAQTEDSSFQRVQPLYRSADRRAAIPLLERSVATNPMRTAAGPLLFDLSSGRRRTPRGVS